MLVRATYFTIALALSLSSAAWAGADVDLAGAPAFVRANPRVVERIDDLLAAARGSTPLARPPAPSPCNATDSGDRIQFTWTDVPGEEGYYLYRDGKIAQTVPSGTTSFEEALGPGTHSYCVIAYNSDGISDPCCETGTQTKLSTPSFCQLSGQPNVRYFWGAVPSADGYRIYIDATLFATVTAPTTSITISLDPDPHAYCVEAFAAGAETSDRCCQVIQAPVPPMAPTACAASNNRSASVLFTWLDVAGESGYAVTRDGQSIKTTGPGVTSYLDNGVFGAHTYCVRAFNPYGASASCCSIGNGISSDTRVRLSWGTCSPQVPDTSFTGPAVYPLVLSVIRIPGTANVGHDTHLTLRPAVPDAWRFDPGGCQTDSRLDARVDSIDPSCPAMLGANPLTITAYSIAADGSAELRLAVVYDDFTPDTDTRYLLWKILFDHSFSIGSTDADPSTCDGALVPLNLGAQTDILLTGNHALTAGLDPSDQPPTWNGGQVPAQKTTWGHVKDMYR